MTARPEPDGFDHALGRGRGVRRFDDPAPRPLTTRDRVRELLRWMSDSSYELRTDRIAYLHAERDAAAALGLMIHHCRWECLDDAGEECSEAITFIYDEDHTERIGIIDMTDPDHGRLYLRDD